VEKQYSVVVIVGDKNVKGSGFRYQSKPQTEADARKHIEEVNRLYLVVYGYKQVAGADVTTFRKGDIDVTVQMIEAVEA